jgi:hypothetical protein
MKYSLQQTKEIPMDNLEATYSLYRSDLEFRMGRYPTDAEWEAMQQIFAEKMDEHYSMEVGHWIETLLPQYME